MKLYAEISKVDDQDDGTIKVYGYASSGSIDAEGEIITPAAMKAAIPDYMKFGAVREMHQPIAAGTAIEAEVQDDGRTWFGAHIVDESAVKKVKTGVYKGFSIGGQVKNRDKINKNTITELRLIEISLVDRPCNPDAILEMFKVDEVETEQVEKQEEIEIQASAEDVEAINKLADMLNKGEVKAIDILDKISKVEPVLDLKKGMYAVGCLAEIIQRVAYMSADVAIETSIEEDNSPLPAMMQKWLASGIDLFMAMSKEETDELLASLPKQDNINDMIMLADQIADIKKADTYIDLISTAKKILTGDEITEVQKTAPLAGLKDALLEKAGSRHSKADLDKLQAAHDHLASLGAKCDSAKADKIDVKDEVISNLTKRLEAIEAQPAPSQKLPVLRVIEKGQDIGQLQAENPALQVQPIMKNGEVDMAATLIKTIHSLGGKPAGFTK